MIGTHAIGAAEFAALATGAGDRDTIAGLRKGQLSKNIIRLRAIMQAAESFPAEFAAARVAEGCALLVAAQERSPEAVAELLVHPQVGACTGRVLWRLRDAGAPGPPLGALLGQVAAIGAAAAVRAGHEFRAELPAHDGQVMLPTLGMSMVDGDTAVVSYRDGRLTVGDGSDWLPLRRLTAETDGVRLTVDLDDIDPYRDGGGELTAAGRLGDDEVAEWQRLLDEAWHLLVTVYRDRAEPMAAGLASLIPVVPAGPGADNSATSRDAFGAVLLTRPPGAARFAENLIHEFQHSKLDAVLDLVPLYEAADGELFYSPARDDPRPLGGILQGAYAFAGVADFWRRAGGAAEFAAWREQVERVSVALLDTGRLTAAGADFVSGMLAQMREWDDAAASAEQREAARDTADDHHVRWRLLNLHPDPATVRALAEAWAGGEPRPGRTYVPPAPRPRPPDAPVNWRLHLRRNPEAYVGQAGAGDVAYVSGEYERAVRLYREQIAAEPGDLDHWAGLLLARRRLAGDEATAALRQMPELVRAVHLAVIERTGAAPDPEDLARWLGLGTLPE